MIATLVELFDPIKNWLVTLIRKTRKSQVNLIETPTRSTLIDHVGTNRHEWVSESGMIPCSISDHHIIYLIRSMCIPKMKKTQKSLTVRKCKNFKQNVFLSELRVIKFDEIKNVTGDPNET